jgi:hypothetical protein
MLITTISMRQPRSAGLTYFAIMPPPICLSASLTQPRSFSSGSSRNSANFDSAFWAGGPIMYRLPAAKRRTITSESAKAAIKVPVIGSALAPQMKSCTPAACRTSTTGSRRAFASANTIGSLLTAKTKSEAARSRSWGSGSRRSNKRTSSEYLRHRGHFATLSSTCSRQFEHVRIVIAYHPSDAAAAASRNV